MRALLASPLGLLIGLSLGALGGGGSILAVPALVYAAGQDPKSATATSLLLVATAALVGLGTHWRAGRVRVTTGVIFGACGIAGSLVGSIVNEQLDPDLLLLGFAVLVVIAAWRMLVGCPTCTRVGETAVLQQTRSEPVAGSHRVAVLVGTRSRPDLTTMIKVLAAGTAVGFLAGLFGVGGGFVIVPALTLVLKLPMPEAIGTSLVVIVINSTVALATRASTTTIEWDVAIPFAVAAVAGVIAGGRLADRLDPQRSLRWFATLLVAVAAYTAIDAIGALT